VQVTTNQLTSPFRALIRKVFTPLYWHGSAEATWG